MGRKASKRDHHLGAEHLASRVGEISESFFQVLTVRKNQRTRLTTTTTTTTTTKTRATAIAKKKKFERGTWMSYKSFVKVSGKFVGVYI